MDQPLPDHPLPLSPRKVCFCGDVYDRGERFLFSPHVVITLNLCCCCLSRLQGALSPRIVRRPSQAMVFPSLPRRPFFRQILSTSLTTFFLNLFSCHGRFLGAFPYGLHPVLSPAQELYASSLPPELTFWFLTGAGSA